MIQARGERRRVAFDARRGGEQLLALQRLGVGQIAPRPDEPQLALYAVAAKEEVSAVAFAKVRPGEMRFMGYSQAESLLPKVQVYRDWKKLLAQWKQDAEALATSFAAGDARVDPKDELKTCRRCDLQTLCRVYEKFSALRTREDGG